MGKASLIKQSQTLMHEWQANLNNADVAGNMDFTKGVLYGMTLMLNVIRDEVGWKPYRPRDPAKVARL